MYKKQEGITLSILVITIIVIVIITGTIIVNTNQYLASKKLINMENDIKILQETMPIYYEQNKSLPVGELLSSTQSSRFYDQRNINDNNEYYIIDLSLLPDFQLNYGYGKDSQEDYYVVNTGSFAVYYLEGLTANGITHYTIDQTNSNVNSNILAPNAFNITAVPTDTTITITGSTTSELGIKGYKFRIDSEQWTDLQENGKYTFENLAPGNTYEISMQAIDNAENIIMADNNGIKVTTIVAQMTNGMFDTEKGLNTPDTSKLPENTTKYVTWKGTGTYTELLHDTVPNNWYDYNTGQWANIKSIGNNLEAYWVWIPRFAYKLPESSTAKEIEVIFVRDKGTTGANGEKCYYSTDTAITTDGSGLYINATEVAKGTEKGKEQAWIVHPAFTFGDTQLSGIWFAKYEASSSNPSAADGGGNTTSLKVQVKPGVTSWRSIQLANSFTVTRAMQDTGGVIGTETGNTTIDTHMAKNMEWAAVSVLSQSKYGVFNPTSSTGINGDKTYKVWNNPNSSFITGTVGETADATNIADSNCSRYNTGNGPMASTTGTVYGVYDMAGGSWEQVMGIMESSIDSNVPSNASTGFSTWPEEKYYDIYRYGETNNDLAAYNRGEIGDLTRELNPASSYTWNNDISNFVQQTRPLFYRGGKCLDGTRAGIFTISDNAGYAGKDFAFRPVLVCEI